MNLRKFTPISLSTEVHRAGFFKRLIILTRHGFSFALIGFVLFDSLIHRIRKL